MAVNSAPMFANPYRPGAGHPPPHLAGRLEEFAEFDRLLEQDVILENLVLTGLRGVGKTVLLDALKPRAIEAGWLWVGSDLSESVSVSEDHLAIRLLADLSILTSPVMAKVESVGIGFQTGERGEEYVPLSHDVLVNVYQKTPGLVLDRLKGALEFAAKYLAEAGNSRVIFAYDEAQNLTDSAPKDQFPLSVLLDLFQSIQKKGIPFMLVMTGLPTLLSKLVQARTFTERMFHVVTVGRLSDEDSADAIEKPIKVERCPVKFSPESVQVICTEAGGYPYFIQFICREVFDVFLQHLRAGAAPGAVPMNPIQRKLDEDFFTGRWTQVTDRQRELLFVMALLGRQELTIQEIIERGKNVLSKPFSSSHASQMLAGLIDTGLVFKNRYGRYSFALPLFGAFILRTYSPPT